MSVSPIALSVGQVFAGRYRVLRLIASGGMGAVYEVFHIETERRRALKVMLSRVWGSPELRERFQREAKVAARIESEFIVDVFDAGVDAETGLPFLVMELLRGEELGERLQRARRFPVGDVVAYLEQIARALDRIHRAGVVHRDLKPENLFLTVREDGPPRIKVLDFGIAKIGRGDGPRETINAGTPAYMAPEQFRPSAEVTPAADVYALGMLAYTLLVGMAYWDEEANEGANVFAIAASAMLGPPEAASVRAARAGVALPAGFDAWFSRATAPRPEDRFAAAGEAAEAFVQAVRAPGGDDAGAHDSMTFVDAVPEAAPRRRAPGVALATAACFAVALSLGWGSLAERFPWMRGRGPDRIAGIAATPATAPRPTGALPPRVTPAPARPEPTSREVAPPGTVAAPAAPALEDPPAPPPPATPAPPRRPRPARARPVDRERGPSRPAAAAAPPPPAGAAAADRGDARPPSPGPTVADPPPDERGDAIQEPERAPAAPAPPSPAADEDNPYRE